MSKNPYLSCCDGRHFVTQESRHRGFFGTTQDQIIARDDGIDIYNQISHISVIHGWNRALEKTRTKCIWICTLSNRTIKQSGQCLDLWFNTQSLMFCLLPRLTSWLPKSLRQSPGTFWWVTMDSPRLLLKVSRQKFWELSMGLFVTRLSLSVSEWVRTAPSWLRTVSGVWVGDMVTCVEVSRSVAIDYTLGSRPLRWPPRRLPWPYCLELTSGLLLHCCCLEVATLSSKLLA